jgi:hypothetical protein
MKHLFMACATLLGFAVLSSAESMVLTRGCQVALAKVRASKTPAAFAASPEGKCGASFNYATTLSQAQARAVQWCAQVGGRSCRVVAVKR